MSYRSKCSPNKNRYHAGGENYKRERENKILLKLIRTGDYNKGYVTLENIASELYISRTTLAQDIKRINRRIEKYSLQISGITNKGVSLNRNEMGIRLLILYELSEPYSESLHDLQITANNKLKQCIQGLIESYSLGINEADLLARNMILTMCRLRLGKKLEKPINYYKNYFSHKEEISDLRKVVEAILELPLGTFDLDYICFPINLGTKKEIYEDHNDVNRLLDEMIELIYTEYQFYIDRSYINVEVRRHLLFLINRSIFCFQTNLFLDSKIEQNYPFAFQISRSAISVIENKLNLSINGEEISLLALYYQLAIQENYKVNRKFGIIKNIGKSLLTLVENRIKLIYFQNCEFIEIDEYDVDNLDPLSINAIFTVNPIHISKPIPVIQINDIFSNQYITEAISQGEVYSIILNERIHCLVDVGNAPIPAYEARIRQQLEKLHKDALIDCDFADQVLLQDIEKISYDNAYVPHALLSDSDRYLLNITIDFDDTKHFEYQVIFLIGIPEKQVTGEEILLIYIYDFVFNLISKLRNTISKEEFMSIVGQLESAMKI